MTDDYQRIVQNLIDGPNFAPVYYETPNNRVVLKKDGDTVDVLRRADNTFITSFNLPLPESRQDFDRIIDYANR